jgi:hypothetical protein
MDRRHKTEGVRGPAKPSADREHIMNDAVGGIAGETNDLIALNTSRRGAPRRSLGFVRRSAIRARRQGHDRVAILNAERSAFAPFGDCAFDGGGFTHT